MIIQCREELAQEIIQLMQPYEATLVEEETGYADSFEKGWIFIQIHSQNPKHNEVLQHISMTAYPHVVGYYGKLLQCGVCENEQNIVIRKIDGECELLWGARTFIIFKKGGKR
ncbi:MAG: hypothetical protein WCS08_06865 [Eubacteriales bacterium]